MITDASDCELRTSPSSSQTLNVFMLANVKVKMIKKRREIEGEADKSGQMKK
jgi:hypothetical protein